MAKIQPKLGLKAGELVQVRSVAEILETLDSNGKLDGLPFMPEMLPYCEKTFRVSKRAHKTCEGGLRLIENTVHLEGLRCDGSAHGGCMAGCLLYWSEAWLKRVDPKHDLIALREADPHTGRERFLKTSEVSSQGEVRYRCQATELPTIGQAQPGRSLHQLIKDLSTGNVGIAQLLTVAHWFVNWLYYKGLRKARWQGAFGGPSPDSSFDPKVGETVCVRSKRELLATVDSRGLHR